LKHYNSKYLMLTDPVINPVGESRSDIEIMFDLARHLAWETSSGMEMSMRPSMS